MMTPFGKKMRDWRRIKGLTQQQQAKMLGVSTAYISALETGTRGQPSAALVDQICVWMGLIWDDAEELKRLAWFHIQNHISMSGASPPMPSIC